MSPWKSTSQFVDPTAKWLWATSNAQSSAPPNILYRFQYVYNNSENIRTATVHVIIDNGGSFILNGSTIGVVSGSGWATTAYSKMSVSLLPGNNLFVFPSYNAGSSNNPAGILISAVDENNNILFSTDSQWKYTK